MDGHAYFDDPHMAELAEALHFTPDDLYYNQKGDLTREQYEYVKHKLYLSYEFIIDILRLLGLVLLFYMLFTQDITLGFVIILWMVGTNKAHDHLMLKWFAFKRHEHVFWTTVKMPNHRLPFRPLVRRERRLLYFPRKLCRRLVPGQTYNVYFVPVKANLHGCYIVSIETTSDRLYLDKYAKQKRKRRPDKTKRAA